MKQYGPIATGATGASYPASRWTAQVIVDLSAAYEGEKWDAVRAATHAYARMIGVIDRGSDLADFKKEFRRLCMLRAAEEVLAMLKGDPDLVKETEAKLALLLKEEK